MKIDLAILIFSIVIVACHSSKKSTGSKTVTQQPVVNTGSITVNRTFDGVYEPGKEELAAVLPKYNDATLAQLKEGYTLYAKSACVSCHNTVNIYTYPLENWPPVIADMSYRSKLTPSQKESVLRYVYAILAAK